MISFIVIGHRAATTGDFKLDDIAGGAGRLDVLVRCVNSAFFLSHDIRREVVLHLCLSGGQDAPKTVRFSGGDIRYLNPDERSTASLIRNALLKKAPAEGEVRSSPGVYVSRMSFEDVVSQLSGRKFVYLREDGTDCREYDFPEDPVFVLGDDRDLTEEEEESLLSATDPDRISIGPLSLHADHCIIVVHNEMDRRRA
jgi:tRNA (pseudouridine54-N1)-methyltransferase